MHATARVGAVASEESALSSSACAKVQIERAFQCYAWAMPRSDHQRRGALPAGTDLRGYTLDYVIGYGGFGIVYRARHGELGLTVAIKEYLPIELAVREGMTARPRSDSGDFADGLRRFRDEARALIALRSHDSIVSCRDFFRANGTAYLVMDYEDGLSLERVLADREATGRPFGEHDLLAVMVPLLEGLSFVHQARILHRDIKPSNILIRRQDGEPVLIDFGAAKQVVAKHTKSLAPYTDGYAALEQVGDLGDLGPWTDIYGVGAVMWRIVAGGNRPWEPPNPLKVETRAAARVRESDDPLPSATELGAGRFSKQLLETIDSCLNLKDSDRLSDATRVVQLLQGSESSRAQEKPAERPVAVPTYGNRPTPDRIPPSPTASSKPRALGVKSALAVVIVALCIAGLTLIPKTDTVGSQVQHWDFTVQSEPSTAEISLLNSTKSYRPGMKLASGQYEITVSAPGYKTRRLWITHAESKKLHIVKLQTLEPKDEQSVTTVPQTNPNSRDIVPTADVTNNDVDDAQLRDASPDRSRDEPLFVETSTEVRTRRTTDGSGAPKNDWDAIKDSRNRSDYERYLQLFSGKPGSEQFVRLAKERLESLDAKPSGFVTDEESETQTRTRATQEWRAIENSKNVDALLAFIRTHEGTPEMKIWATKADQRIREVLGLDRNSDVTELENHLKRHSGKPGFERYAVQLSRLIAGTRNDRIQSDRNSDPLQDAWKRAQSVNTREGYKQFIENFADNLGSEYYIESAKAALSDLVVKPGKKIKDCPVCPELVVIPSGSFVMGSPKSESGRESNEGPMHTVHIQYMLAVGVTEVTFDEWDSCLGDGGCDGYRPNDEGWGRGRRPVINVKWSDAQNYVMWLSEKAGRHYRLLSEAEWEYVARAGTRTRFWWGDDVSSGRANCATCGSPWDSKMTAPVGQFKENPFGLHDIHGNVWEWVQDGWHFGYKNAPGDGSPWMKGTIMGRFVLRGGAWNSKPKELRSASRHAVEVSKWVMRRSYLVTKRRKGFGFRVARVISP